MDPAQEQADHARRDLMDKCRAWLRERDAPLSLADDLAELVSGLPGGEERSRRLRPPRPVRQQMGRILVDLEKSAVIAHLVDRLGGEVVITFDALVGSGRRELLRTNASQGMLTLRTREKG